MKNCLKLLLLFLCVASAFGADRLDEASFDSLLASARQAQARNDYTAAADYYKQALKIQPQIPEVWANLGLMEHEAREYSDAIQSFQQANRLKASLFVPTLFLGIDYVYLGKAKMAIPFLLRAEALNPTDPQAPLALGRAYLSLDNDSSAARQFAHAIDLDPKLSAAWFSLGIAYLNQVELDARRMSMEGQNSPYAEALYAESLVKQSRYQEAIDSYIHKSLTAPGPKPPCLHSEVGFLYLKKHDSAGAESEFAVERKANPGCALASLGQVRLDLEAGSNADGLQLLEALWNRDSGFVRSSVPILADGMPLERSASFLDFLSQQQDAGKLQAGLYESLSAGFRGLPQPAKEIAAAPESNTNESPTRKPSSVASRQTAEEDYELGQYGRCASRLRDGLAKENGAEILLLANCSFQAGDYELSSNASAALKAKSPHNLVALYWSIKSNEKLALRALEHFEQLAPNSAKTHILLGDMYRQRRLNDDAEAEYTKALEISSNDPAALLGLTSAYLGASKFDEAIATARVALLQSPLDPELNLLMGEALVLRSEFQDAEPFLKKSLTAKPQQIPHVHALLGEVYSETNRTQDAIDQLKMGLEDDNDGTIHYQLARLYTKLGDSADASVIMEQTKILQQQRRERAVVAVHDSHPSTSADEQQ